MLDKESPIPIYYQLQKIILEKIEKGIWLPKTRIPSERELAEQYKVSRMTMRNALATLEQSGALSREIGRGTFVAEPKISQELNRLTGFSADMRTQGKQPGARIINLATIIVLPKLAPIFKLDPTERIVQIERLRLADNEPMSIECANVYFPGCLQLLQDDLSGSLYELLNSSYGLSPTRARQQISAGLSNKRESELLEIRLRSPVLRLTRLTFDQYQRPFEFVESTYRSDKYIFDVELVVNSTVKRG